MFQRVGTSPQLSHGGVIPGIEIFVKMCHVFGFQHVVDPVRKRTIAGRGIGIGRIRVDGLEDALLHAVTHFHHPWNRVRSETLG